MSDLNPGGIQRSSLSGSTWKLVVTPLNGPGETREVAVEAENWLSALRAARRELGEDGGMPPGASCVMSAEGEVTILDSAQRIKYVLARVSVAAAPRTASHAGVSSPVAPPSALPAAEAAPEPLAKPAPGGPSPRRSVTVAYSPEESADARRLIAQAPAPQAPSAVPQPTPRVSPSAPAAWAPPAARAPEVAAPPTRGPAQQPSEPAGPGTAKGPPGKRSVTVAYSPEESAQFRQQIQDEMAARARAQSPAPTPESTRAPTFAAPSASAPAVAQPPVTVEYRAPAPPFTPARPGPAQAPASVVPSAPPSAAPAGGRKATVAYLTSPFPGGELVPLHGRDEEPSNASPLTYRERSFFAPKPIEPARLEAILRTALEALQHELSLAARGKFVNLAVFDHSFQGRPQRPPIATLQWKDWRGNPVFSLAGNQPLPSWHPTAQGPVATSFAPPAPASVAPQSAPAPVPFVSAPLSTPVYSPAPPAILPAQPAAVAFIPPAPAPTSAAPVAFSPPVAFAPPRQERNSPVPQGAPQSPLVTPMQPLPAAPSEADREPTGDQDRRLAVAFEASQDLYFLGTPLEALEFAVKLLGDLIPSEAASGCLYDINTDEFRFVALTGPGAVERRAEAVPSTAGLLSAAVRSQRESFVIADAESDPRYDPGVDGRIGLTASNLAYLPLQRKDQLLGMLQLINRQSRQGFSEADMAVAAYIAAQVGEFLAARRRR
jgi:hypothetical protein